MTQTIAQIDHRQVTMWTGGPGECGVECACELKFDGFDSVSDASDELSQHVKAERAATERAEYAAGLRALADLIEQHVDLVLPFDGRTSGLSVLVTNETGQREKLAAWARALPGEKTKRQAGIDGHLFRVSGKLRGLKVDVIADRVEVCERVVVGEREVTETVPDPEAVAALPTKTVTRVEEIVEWRCTPVLADASTGSAAE